MENGKSLKLIYSAFAVALILLGFVFYQSQGVEGGLDSWNHFLISKCAIKHPELLLDQWNKPVFTWCTVLICQYGLNAMITFNVLCVAFSGLLNALALKHRGYSHAWAAVPFTVFTPILFQNTISALTEPLNVLMLALVFYFWSREQLETALILASFLPFVRTEGFVICGAVFLLILLRKEYKMLLWLLPGSVVMNLVGFAISGKPFWIISENPYWKHETEGTFDPGSGSIMHFIEQARAMFGLPMLALFIVSIGFMAYMRYKKKKTDEVMVLALLVFVFYFMAHALIYYFGILGSHGLTRPMAVIAGPLALLSVAAIDYLCKSLKESLRSVVFAMLALAVVWTGYAETGYAKPHRIHEASVKPDKTQKNFIKAGEWLIANGLMHRPIINQSPYFDVYFDKDPYDLKSSYRVWSIDQKNDWAEKGVIVIWDGFSAVREGNMKLDWLMNNPNYKLLHSIEGFEKPDDDPSMYDVHIFVKVN